MDRPTPTPAKPVDQEATLAGQGALSGLRAGVRAFAISVIAIAAIALALMFVAYLAGRNLGPN